MSAIVGGLDPCATLNRAKAWFRARSTSLVTSAVLIAASALVAPPAEASPASPPCGTSCRREVPAQEPSFIPGPASVALTDDAVALLLNPAAICRSVPSGGYLLWGRSRGDTLEVGTALLAARGFGLGYQSRDLDGASRLQRILIGSAVGPHAVSVGFRTTYEWQRRLYRDAAWRIDSGILWRPFPYLSLGAVARDINEAALFRERYARSYTAGIGLRPPGDALRDRLTLHADFTGPEDRSWREAGAARAGIWVEPVDGISVGAAIDGPLDDFSNRSAPSVGLRFDFLHSSLVGNLFFDSDNERTHQVQGMHFTKARQRTMQREKTITRVTVKGNLADESQSGNPIPLIGGPSYASARPILEQLATARKDRHVRGVLLDLHPFTAGALSDEIRDEIHRVRVAGKPVVAYSTSLTNRAQLYVASACDRIVMDEVGLVMSLGIRGDIPYLGEMLDSLGIRYEQVARGKYKSGYEPLALSRPSEGMLESMNSIIDDRNEHQLSRIAEERKVDRTRLEELTSGRWWTPKEALEAGLVDSLGDMRCARRIVARLADMKGEPEPVSAAGWVYPDYEWAIGPKVAVLWLDGAIVEGKSSKGFMSDNTIGSETVVNQLRDLAGRRDVKAVVLRIDSGGGDGIASDQIWRAVDHLKKKGKKVVTSMARVAGSGGYYIACNSDKIFADPTTITGSIGVFMGKLDLTGFYDRRKVYLATFERGAYMGLLSSSHRLTQEERDHIQQGIDHFYGIFLDRIQAGRGMERDAIDAVGQGRIWTGRQAKERGLIDEVGGLEEAIGAARDLAGLHEAAKVEHIRRPTSFFERIFTSASVDARLRGQREQAAVDLLRSALTPDGGAAAIAGARDPLTRWTFRRSLRSMEDPAARGVFSLENPLIDLLATED